MSQQINLLPPRPRRDRYLQQVAVLLGITALGSGLWWNALRQDTQALQAQVQSQARQVAELQARDAARRPVAPRPPVGEAEALAREAAGLKELLAEIRRPGLGRPQGYSDILEQLARVPHPETWLTQIDLGPRGQSMALIGLGLSEEAVAQYAAQLNRQLAPQGVQLRSLELTRPPASGPISFKVY